MTYQLSKEWTCRPSELLDVEDPVEAFCFDRAVSTFGSALQAALEGAKGKTDKARAVDRERILGRWIPSTKASQTKRFRDPAREKV